MATEQPSDDTPELPIEESTENDEPEFIALMGKPSTTDADAVHSIAEFVSSQPEEARKALVDSVLPSMTSISNLINQTYYSQFAEIQRNLANIAKIQLPLLVPAIDWAKLANLSAVNQAAQVADIQQSIANTAMAQLAPAIRALDWSKMIKLPAIDYTRQFTFPAIETSWLKPLTDQVSKTFAGLNTDFIQQLQEQIRKEHELLRREGPDNWTELNDSVNLFALLDLAEEGIPVTWVPGPTVLEALTTAEKPDRLGTLLSHQIDALNACGSVLVTPQSGPLTEQATLLGQAVGAMKSGLFAAAQALAASVIDTVIRRVFPRPQGNHYSALQKKIKSSYDAQLIDLRSAATYWPILPAFRGFFEHHGDPIPSDFNRHATAHAVSLTQYTEANALLAVLLATSIVREAHIQLATSEEADPEHPDSTTI